MEEKQIKIKIPLGIPGFETYHEWNLILEKDTHLAQLVAINSEYVGFVLTHPEVYFPLYIEEIELDFEGEQILSVQCDTKLEVWNILCLDNDVLKTTINLKAPIIINLEKQLGYQLILNEEKYNSKVLLFSQKEERNCSEGVTG
ncbi:Flagellar assembly factor fliW [Syntrophobotulus glycolicus DSM 8271]|uniref:Flagellar assembly factor FliW n=1 Tax=Syntrophobotulus glycolicus (strain DSM 8271 / FlGlyR) TaxID=645991 RepID=F0SZD9_SYNGF|nr:flagellar assembly protein FliW [Syntrophobotulus glycolicus]ADY54944.1 Flagellar assembly factor fliW [Syntrophobotulus glycolicus DSM 8271]